MIFAFANFSVVLFSDKSPAGGFTYFNTTLCKDYIKQGNNNRKEIAQKYFEKGSDILKSISQNKHFWNSER